MKGLIHREPADLLGTGERSKVKDPGINTTTLLALSINPIDKMEEAYTVGLAIREDAK